MNSIYLTKAKSERAQIYLYSHFWIAGEKHIKKLHAIFSIYHPMTISVNDYSNLRLFANLAEERVEK